MGISLEIHGFVLNKYLKKMGFTHKTVIFKIHICMAFSYFIYSQKQFRVIIRDEQKEANEGSNERKYKSEIMASLVAHSDGRQRNV